MREPTIPGFAYSRIPGADGLELNVAYGGAGSPVVLLHGFPQTHLMWSVVARGLSRSHTVIVPESLGSSAPATPGARSAHPVSAAAAALLMALMSILPPGAIGRLERPALFSRSRY